MSSLSVKGRSAATIAGQTMLVIFQAFLGRGDALRASARSLGRELLRGGKRRDGRGDAIEN
jgi:hypothetical protein